MADRTTSAWAAPAAEADVRADPAAAPSAASGALLPTMTLAWREIVRFLRQRSRVLSALGSPIVFWALIGLGLGRSFAPLGGTQPVNYLEYFFPGTLVLILLFSSVFSNSSVIEDRREGFLQGVLVSPAPRSSIVLGKLLGGTILAAGQGLVFCLFLLTPWSGLRLGPGAWIELIAVVFLVAFAMTAMGFLIAWPMDSTQGFHAIMNLVLIPLWLLSGALFPASGAPAWLQWIITLNPITYGVLAVQWVFYDDVSAVTGGRPPGPVLAFGVTIAFAAVLFAACVAVAGRVRKMP